MTTRRWAIVRDWGWETIAFRGATVVALLHAVDDAFLNRQPGVGPGQHAVAAAISLAAGVGAIVVFPRLRPGLRAGIALVFGVFAIVNGDSTSLTSRWTARRRAITRAFSPSPPASCSWGSGW